MLVSIIIPLYNKVDYIRDCLESCINQSYSDIEIVVVDDCSTDGSYEIAKEVLSTYKGNYLLLQNKVNSGSGITRNNGLKSCTGDKVFFMDADDILHKNTIDTLMYYAIDKSAYMVEPLDFKETPQWLDSRVSMSLLKSAPQQAWGILIDKQLLLDYDIWFTPKTNVGDDNLFSSDLFGVCKIYTLGVKYYGFRKQVSGSLTSGHWLDYKKDIGVQCFVIKLMHDKLSYNDTRKQKKERITFIRKRKHRVYEDKILLKDKGRYMETSLKIPIKYIISSGLSFSRKINEIMLNINYKYFILMNFIFVERNY